MILEQSLFTLLRKSQGERLSLSFMLLFVVAVLACDLFQFIDVGKRIIDGKENDQENDDHDKGQDIAQGPLMSLLLKLAIDFIDGGITLEPVDTVAGPAVFLDAAPDRLIVFGQKGLGPVHSKVRCFILWADQITPALGRPGFILPLGRYADFGSLILHGQVSFDALF